MSEERPVGVVDAETAQQTRQQAAAAQRVLVKTGTNSLTDDESHLDRVKLDKIVADVMDLRERGVDVVLVSSGAVGAGTGVVGRTPESVEQRQALSTVGQSQLMRHYTQSFDRFDQTVAQILLTRTDFHTTERFENFHATIETLLEWDVVPIINENDAVATDELQIGDNDMISAAIATGIDIELLVTLTDVSGLYTGNPKRNADAELVETVGENYADIRRIVEETGAVEFGGIATKVEAARDASEHGIPAIIAGSAEADVLDRVARADPVGTIFVPAENPDVDDSQPGDKSIDLGYETGHMDRTRGDTPDE
jgi:glutamate 5-kinase